jgi:hypothetical protein
VNARTEIVVPQVPGRKVLAQLFTFMWERLANMHLAPLPPTHSPPSLLTLDDAGHLIMFGHLGHSSRVFLVNRHGLQL